MNYSPANCQGVPQESKGAVGEPEKIQDDYYFANFFWDRFSVGKFARLKFALDRYIHSANILDHLSPQPFD